MRKRLWLLAVLCSGTLMGAFAVLPGMSQSTATVRVESPSVASFSTPDPIRPPRRVIPRATPTTTPAPTSTVAPRAQPVSRVIPRERAVSSAPTNLYAAWSKVAVCEEGGWIGYASYNYPDSLGIKRANWFQFGGGSDVSPSAQIAVAMRLIAYYHAGIPDQHGCQRGGW